MLSPATPPFSTFACCLTRPRGWATVLTLHFASVFDTLLDVCFVHQLLSFSARIFFPGSVGSWPGRHSVLDMFLWSWLAQNWRMFNDARGVSRVMTGHPLKGILTYMSPRSIEKFLGEGNWNFDSCLAKRDN